MIRIKLGEVLKQRGITQRELHEATGIRLASISDMVNNKYGAINKEFLATIMQYLNMNDVSEFIEFVDTKEKTPAE